MAHTHETPGDLRKLVEVIKDIRVAMLVTPAEAHPSGVHARPMYTQALEPDGKPFDGDLWFLTDRGSAKTREIGDGGVTRPVLITYADPGKNRFAVVYGSASVERNPEKARELWNVHAKGWYPDGPDDPRLVLIRVRVKSAEYWDGPSNVSYMLHLAKAVMTGTQVEVKAEHATIELHAG